MVPPSKAKDSCTDPLTFSPFKFFTGIRSSPSPLRGHAPTLHPRPLHTHLTSRINLGDKRVVVPHQRRCPTNPSSTAFHIDHQR